jgi:hypothetical protein
MFVEFLAPSPKAGLKEHVSREVAASLIAAGFAKAAQMTDVDRDALRQASHDDVVVPRVPVPTWTVIRHGLSGETLVVRKYGFQTWYFDGPPDLSKWPDCPETIAEEFERMKSQPQKRVGLTEAQRNEMLRQGQKIRWY